MRRSKGILPEMLEDWNEYWRDVGFYALLNEYVEVDDGLHERVIRKKKTSINE